mgnify:CR=1 FL=1
MEGSFSRRISSVSAFVSAPCRIVCSSSATASAGTYDALQINIGRAKGHNWWCMLYPSICFSDALRPVNEDGESAEKVEKSRILLQNLLSDAAYREILKSDRISFRFFWR